MVAEAAVSKISYEVNRGTLVLRLFGRDTEGHRVALRVLGTEPYFFALASEAGGLRANPSVVKILPGPNDLSGRPMVKVVTRYPFEVPEIRKNLSYHGEADVPYSLRTRGEHHLNFIEVPPQGPVSEVNVREIVSLESAKVVPRVITLDIETEDRKGFSRPEKPQAPVLSIAFHDSGRDRYIVLYTLEGGPDIDPEAVRKVVNDLIPGFAPEVVEPIILFRQRTEADMLAAFGDLVGKLGADYIDAYNGSEYDFPYLANRVGLLLDGQREPNADLLRVVDTFDEDRSRNSGESALIDSLAILRKKELKAKQYSLESIAQELLGYGKYPRDTTVGELRRTNPTGFVGYNLLDVVLNLRIRVKEDLLGYAVRIANATNTEVADIYHSSRLVDGLLFDVARESGSPEIALPSSSFAPENQRVGLGSAVFDPKVGFWVAVVAIDFAEEYPSLIQTFNIDPTCRLSPESREPAYRLPTGGVYRISPKGLVYRALARIRRVRKEAKALTRSLVLGSPERKDADTVSAAIKAVINAFAGVIGSPHWRMGNVDAFEDITGMARLQLQKKKALLEDTEFLSPVVGFRIRGEVLQGDTDSTFVIFFGPDDQQITDLDRLNSEIVPKVVAALQKEYDAWFASLGAETNFTSDSVDGIFESLRTLPLASGDGKKGAKKRYYGLLAFDGNKDVRDLPYERRVQYVGLEVKRRNESKIAKTVQKTIIEQVLTRKPVAESREYLDEIRTTVLAGGLDDDLLIPVQLSKDRGEYEVDGAPDFVRAIDHYRALTGRIVQPGDEFHWAYVRNGVSYAKSGGNDGSRFDNFAFPYRMSVAEALTAGFVFEIDRKRMYEKVVESSAKKVLPEIIEVLSSMGAEW